MEQLNLEQRIDKLCSTITDRHHQRYPNNPIKNFEVIKGKRYYKLMDSGSVHAFVDINNGYMYKPASYKGPAKIMRYNLLDDTSYEACLHNADPHGGYLYIR